MKELKNIESFCDDFFAAIIELGSGDRAWRLFDDGAWLLWIVAQVGGNAKSIRHFYASAMEFAGFERESIQDSLGHARGSKCTDIYLHKFDSQLIEASNKLDNMLAGVMKKRRAN